MLLSGIRDKRENAREAVAAIAVWLGDHDIPLTSTCLFRCRILPPEEEWPLGGEWGHAISVMGETVIETGPFMLDEWGDKDERFRKLRMYAALSWYLSATGNERIVAEAMVEWLHRKLFDIPELTKAAAKAAARKAGLASHPMDNKFKRTILAWLRENARNAETQASLVKRLVQENLEPVKPSTLKTWVREWHKSDRK